MMRRYHVLATAVLSLGLGSACAPPALPPATGAVRVGGSVLIPGGTAAIGTDSSEIPSLMARYRVNRADLFASEVPRRTVTFVPFFLDRTEVTKARFAEFVRAKPAWRKGALPATAHNGRYLEDWPNGEVAPGEGARPVAFITWPAASAFCAWTGKRLPTEAEWEYGASGGMHPAEFPWGDALPDSSRANWARSRHGRPVDVGSYPPNGYDLYDVAGNVWEFVADRWTPGPGAADDASTRYVIRGGSYDGAAVNLRVRYRDSHAAGNAGPQVGFRCARDS